MSGSGPVVEVGSSAPWWKTGIVYQIYPRSFQDSNGDGIGDLRGIIERIDHLTTLGVDALWLSPIFPSPMADFGYDVADYCDVDRIFGSLADFNALVAAAHSRGLKILLDFVPNHSSDRHPWFLESRSSRSSAKRDWYIWHDAGDDGGPPNNWLSHFGGGAWEWDEGSSQYYLHSFLKEQPDLNWRNPEVRTAMLDVLRFWLERGVDGFRVDVIWLLIKDALFRDNPPNPAWREDESSYERLLPVYTSDRPEVHDVIAEMRRVTDAYEDRVLIGEIYLPVERLVAYYGENLEGAHLPFNFQLLRTSWTAENLARIITEYEAALPEGAWPNWVLGNHDQPRIASRVGSVQARVAAMLLLTLRGTPTIYYGEEIGMYDAEIPPDAVQDPAEKNQPGIGVGRDPQRTPMQWDDGPCAGFSSARPWLPVSPAWRSANVALQERQTDSMLNLYRRLIELRRSERPLTSGSLADVEVAGSGLSFRRVEGKRKLRILLNLAGVPAEAQATGTVLLSTSPDSKQRRLTGDFTLSPDEGMIIEETNA